MKDIEEICERAVCFAVSVRVIPAGPRALAREGGGGGNATNYRCLGGCWEGHRDLRKGLARRPLYWPNELEGVERRAVDANPEDGRVVVPSEEQKD